MADFPQVRRILYMHPAHRTVGVSGVAPSFRDSRCLESAFSDNLADAPCRVLLIAGVRNRRVAAAMDAFERALAGNDSLYCERVDFAAGEERLATANCAVVFGRGIQIVRCWSAVDSDLLGDSDEDEGIDAEVQVASAAARHPVLSGVGTFIAECQLFHSPYLRSGAMRLLVRRWAGREFVVAWASDFDEPAFYSVFGDPRDFRRREFVRLLKNAIEWIGMHGVAEADNGV
jgi:hypothetical protein